MPIRFRSLTEDGDGELLEGSEASGVVDTETAAAHELDESLLSRRCSQGFSAECGCVSLYHVRVRHWEGERHGDTSCIFWSEKVVALWYLG